MHLPLLLYLKQATRFLNRLPEAAPRRQSKFQQQPTLTRAEVRENATLFREFLNRGNQIEIPTVNHLLTEMRQRYQRPVFETASISLGIPDDFLSNLRLFEEIGNFGESSLKRPVDLRNYISTDLAKYKNNHSKIKKLAHKIRDLLDQKPKNQDIVLEFSHSPSDHINSDIIAHALALVSETHPQLNRRIYLKNIEEPGRFVQQYTIKKRVRYRTVKKLKPPETEDVYQVRRLMREQDGNFAQILRALEDLETAQLILGNPKYSKNFSKQELEKFLLMTFGTLDLIELKATRQKIGSLFSELAEQVAEIKDLSQAVSKNTKNEIHRLVSELRKVPVFENFDTNIFIALVTHTPGLAVISFHRAAKPEHPRIRRITVPRYFPQSNGSRQQRDDLIDEVNQFIVSSRLYLDRKKPSHFYINFNNYPSEPIPYLHRLYFGASEIDKIILAGRHNEDKPFLQHILISGIPEDERLDVLMMMRFQLATHGETLASNAATMRLAENFGIPPLIN